MYLTHITQPEKRVVLLASVYFYRIFIKPPKRISLHYVMIDIRNHSSSRLNT